MKTIKFFFIFLTSSLLIFPYVPLRNLEINAGTRITGLAYLGDNKIAVSSWDKIIRIFDISPNFSDPYPCINKMNGDKKCLWHCFCLYWKLFSKERCLKELQGHESFVTCLINLGNNKIASGSYDHTVRIWDLSADIPENERCIAIFKGHEAFITALTYLENDRLASADRNGEIRVWDIASETYSIFRFDERNQEFARCLAYTENNKFVSGSSNGLVHVFDTSTGIKTLDILDGARGGFIHSIIYLGNDVISTSHELKKVTIYDIRKKETLYECGGYGAIHFNENKLITVKDNQIQIRKFTKEFEYIKEGSYSIKHEYNEIKSLSYAFDTGNLIAGADDGTIRIYQVGQIT